MYCNNCGNVLSANDNFCPKCGQPVIKAPNMPPIANPNIPVNVMPPPVANYPVNQENFPAVNEAKKKKKKKGCLITAILLIVITVVLLIIDSLTPLSTTSNISSSNNSTPINQEVDINELTTPSDLRGEGLAGYWASAEVLDAEGNLINDAQIVALLHLDEGGNCQLRMIENEESDDFSGTYDGNTANIYDSYSDITFSFSIVVRNGDLHLGMGEDLENLTFVFEGPYDEETLVYQNLEYLKAGGFTTSAMLENQGQSNLTYTQWEQGITLAYSYWMSLFKLSKALEFAVDIYINSEMPMGGLETEIGSIVYSSYMQYDVDEVQGVIDLATSTNRIKKLAEHFQITAQEAAQVLFEVQNNITQKSYKDEQFYGKCETYAKRISTASKVTLLICGTVASGGTLTLGEGAVFFIQGADVAMEITENEAYIAVEIEGKESSRKALEMLEHIRTGTAPSASIVGLKGLRGTGFEKFMVLKDTAFDAVDGKICAIRVTDSSTGTMQVSQIAPEDFDGWKAANNAQGYQLTNADREDIWSEIYAKVQELEAQESASAEEIVAQNPVQPTDNTVTAEPIIESTLDPESETSAAVSNNPFVGIWVMTSTYYPSGLDYPAQDMGEYFQPTVYEFKENLKVDIYVVLEGAKQYFYQDRPYRLDGGMVIIDEIPNDENYFVYKSRTICKITNNKLLVDFDSPNPVVYVLELLH